jgi:MerC mercury resistance protein
MKLQKNTHMHHHYANKWSVALSFICAVHCILTPVLLIALPFAGPFLHQYHGRDLFLTGGVFVLGTSSILHGFKFHHQKKAPAYLFIGGLVLMCSALILEYGYGNPGNAHHIVSALGGILAGIGQLYNFKLSS